MGESGEKRGKSLERFRSFLVGVEFFVDFLEVGVGYVGVDLGCADVGVTEEGLDGANIGAVH